MVTAPHQTYIVVADSAHAHFFDLKAFCKKNRNDSILPCQWKICGLRKIGSEPFWRELRRTTHHGAKL
jgi:hypothetical protein